MNIIKPFVASLILVLAAPLASLVAADKPNVLFLFADDQRADTIAAHGNPHIKTPNLDQLAAAGFSFRGNYVFGGNSGAVCIPSRAMLMSGKNWFRIDTATLKGVKLMPEFLRENGYVTFGTGKWHNGQASWLRAFQRGKTVMFGGMSDHTKVPVRDLDSDGKLSAERIGEKFSSEMFADSAIEFLRTRDGSQPFLAYVAFTAPHDPRQPPLSYREPYYRSLPPLPVNFRPQLPFDNGMMIGGRDENLGAWPRTEAMIRDQLAEYYGLITHMDEQIGRILTALRESGEAENTIVIFAADNGLALGSHGLLGKQSVFEHSMRTPLIVAGPGIPSGKSTTAFTYLFDLFPTLCDLLALQPPADLDGVSLRPIWTNEKQRVRDSVFLPLLELQRAVRDERWKLIAYPKIGHLQLFDLQSDPYEMTNLIDRPEHVAHVERLQRLMKQWQTKVGDTLEVPTKNRIPAPIDLTGRPRVPDPWQPDWIVKKYFGGADTPPRPALGINLAGPADWNTELPFADVFRLSRAWISQKKGAGWGQGPALELDERGWVKRLEPDCFAETPLCTIEGGHYPNGDWTVLWDGEGRIELSKGKVTQNGQGRIIVNLDSKDGGFFLRVRETNAANPVRNIRVLMPGITAADVAQNPWHPSFLDRWRGTACLRFMDFQETNNSQQRQWADRPRPDDATFTRKGIPVELLCDLANRLETDAWFCLPHEADDDYVREFAQRVKEKLDPKRRVYIEYSNEDWNGQFQQHRYAAEQGQKLGLAEKSWEAAWRYTAHRSMQIFGIWEQVFGGRERLVRVLPTQAANSYVATQITGWKGAGHNADVLAIAPYVSMNIPKDGKKLTADEVATWNVDQFLDYVEANALPESNRWMAENRKIADQYGLKLVAYEAGQHFVGVAGGENNETLTRLLHAANAHPRMAVIYAKYFAAWEANGGDLLCHFSSVGKWSKWGSWGLLQFADDETQVSPKFVATMKWAKKLGQPVNVP